MIENIGQGGAERQLIGLASMLAQDGNEVKIVIYNADFFYLPLLKGTGVECEYIAKAENKLRRVPQIIKFIKRYKPDTVISYLRTPSTIACIAKLVLRNFKLIVSERNTNQSITLRDKIRFSLFRRADWIVPNSYSQKQFIDEHYPELNPKTVTITNFVDTEHFCPMSGGKVSLDNTIIQIACVGRVCEQKNVKLFLQAVKSVVDSGLGLSIDWYGLDFPPYSDECKELKTTLGLDDVFRFHKETSKVKSVYQSADVMVLPSIYEGFPNVVCEAMSCGLPVLCSDVCDNGRIVRDGENGFLFNPHSKDSIAGVITRFVNLDKSERVRMGMKSREYALTDFSKESFYNKYKELIYGE